TVGHIEIIQGLHRDGDVGNPLIDLFLRSRPWDILKDHTGLRIHGAGFEVRLPVPADESAKPLPAIQDADFRPQIHETVGGRCPSQANPPFDKWPYLPKPLKSLRLVVLER